MYGGSKHFVLRTNSQVRIMDLLHIFIPLFRMLELQHLVMIIKIQRHTGGNQRKRQDGAYGYESRFVYFRALLPNDQTDDDNGSYDRSNGCIPSFEKRDFGVIGLSIRYRYSKHNGSLYKKRYSRLEQADEQKRYD